MASINKVIIVGNLGNDPEVRYTPSNDPVTTISVATTEYWKDKQSGERQEKTEWHRIVFFGGLADVAQKYLHKGSQVYVEGRLQTSKYTDNNGIERYQTNIRGDVMQMLGSKGDSQSAPQQAPAPQRKKSSNSYADAKNGRNAGYTMNPDVPDDDIPF